MKKLFHRLSGYLASALLLATVFVPSSAHAATTGYTANETWNASACTIEINGAPTATYGIMTGDTLNVAVVNQTSYILNIDYSTDVNHGGTGQPYNVNPGDTVTVPLSNVQSNETLSASADTSCGGSTVDSQLTAKPGSANLACTTNQAAKTWSVSGSYTNLVSGNLYNGSSLAATTPGGSGSINQSFGATTSGATFYFNDGTSNSYATARLLAQASCSAIPASVTPPPKTTTTPIKTTASPTTTTTPTPTPATSTTTPTVTSSPQPTDLSVKDTSAKGKPTNVTALAILLTVLALMLLLSFVSTWKTFTKAGRPGWAAIVPVYGSWVIYELGDKPGWWAIVQLIPFVNIVALVVFILAEIEIAKKFGKSALFGFFGLFLFWFIGWPILGFGKATYISNDFQEPQPPITPFPIFPQ